MFAKFLPIAAATLLAAASLHAVSVETALGEAISVSEQALNSAACYGMINQDITSDIVLATSSNPEHDMARLFDNDETTTLVIAQGDVLRLQFPDFFKLDYFRMEMQVPEYMPMNLSVDITEENWKIIRHTYPNRYGCYQHDPAYDNQGLVITFDEDCELSELTFIKVYEGWEIYPNFAQYLSNDNIESMYAILNDAKVTADNEDATFEEKLETYNTIITTFQPIVDIAYMNGIGSYFAYHEITDPNSLIALTGDEGDPGFEETLLANAIDVTNRCITASSGMMLNQDMVKFDVASSYCSNPAININDLFDQDESTICHIEYGDEIYFEIDPKERLEYFSFVMSAEWIPMNLEIQLCSDGEKFRNAYCTFNGGYQHDPAYDNQGIKVIFYEDCDLAEFYPINNREEFRMYETFADRFDVEDIYSIQEVLAQAQAAVGASADEQLEAAMALREAGYDLSEHCLSMGYGDEYRYMELPTIPGDDIMLMSLYGEEGGNTAGISELGAQGKGKVKAYDLSGRPVNPTRPGFYIINGRKVKL